MTRSRMRAMSAALVVAAALVLTGCSSDSDDATSDESSPAQTETAAQEVDPNAPVEVSDVTNLILETAQQTLEAQGLTVDVVDESGAAVTVEDPTTYTVSAQDPADGTVDPGSTVTLTVAPRG